MKSLSNGEVCSRSLGEKSLENRWSLARCRVGSSRRRRRSVSRRGAGAVVALRRLAHDSVAPYLLWTVIGVNVMGKLKK